MEEGWFQRIEALKNCRAGQWGVLVVGHWDTLLFTHLQVTKKLLTFNIYRRYTKRLCRLLVFLNTNRNNQQAHGITVVALHPEVFSVSYFPQGTEVFF